MSNNFQVFCSRATPASPWTWPPRHQAMRRHDVASPTAYDRSPPRPTPRGSLARTPRPRVPRPSAPHPLPHPQHAVPRCTQVSAAPFCELCPTTDTLPGPPTPMLQAQQHPTRPAVAPHREGEGVRARAKVREGGSTRGGGEDTRWGGRARGRGRGRG